MRYWWVIIGSLVVAALPVLGWWLEWHVLDHVWDRVSPYVRRKWRRPFTSAKLQKAHSDVQRARNFIDVVIANCQQIFGRVYPYREGLRLQFEAYSATYEIGNDGTAEVTFECSVCAVGGNLRAWEFSVGVEREADEMEYPTDIRFQVSDISSGSNAAAAYLPLDNRSRDKRMAIFFLPEISETEGARRIRISYTWPGFARKILQAGWEEFSWPIRSANPIPLVEFKVRFPKEIANVTCEFVGSRPSAHTLNEVSDGHGTTWHYASKLPSTNFTHSLKFMKRMHA